jgi:glutathione S-transferase
VIAQTLAIATFLASELALDGDLDRRRRTVLDMATQAAHLDMQVPYRELLWRRPDLPDDKLLAMAGVLREHLLTKTRQLEALFAGAQPGGPYFGGAAPAMADYFVYESLDRASAVFGTAFESELAKQPAMQGLWRALGERPRIAAYLDAGGVPFNVTASPWEKAHRARLRD